MPFYIGVIIQLFAIAIQLFNTSETSRIYAALNTSFIWLIACGYYTMFIRMDLTKNVCNKLNRYVKFIIIVFLFLYIFSLIYDKNTINILGMNLNLKKADYLSSGVTSRFCALMETPLATSHMFILLMPVISVLPREKKDNNAMFVLTSFFYIAVLSGHSRMGMIISTICYLSYLIKFLTYKKIDMQTKRLVFVFIFIICLLITVLNYNFIKHIIIELFIRREGSNNARFQIYRLSIRKVMLEAPLWGIGIKYMISSISLPYGSHSTYIGLFYKVGILGMIVFLYGFYKILKRIIKLYANSSISVEIIIMITSYFVFLIFADIDGIDWVIVLAFSIWALIQKVERREDRHAICLYNAESAIKCDSYKKRAI